MQVNKSTRVFFNGTLEDLVQATAKKGVPADAILDKVEIDYYPLSYLFDSAVAVNRTKEGIATYKWIRQEDAHGYPVSG